MPVSVTMPRLGESVTEGTVTRWLKQEGDTVEVDEPLLEVSTDKVDTEIPSPAAGVLSRIVVGEDETAEVGSELAIIAGEGEDAGAAPKQEAEPATEPTAAAEGTGPEPEQQAEEAAAEPGAEAEQPAVEEPAQPAASSGEGTPVTMPALGESVTEGTVTRWLKQVGETVEVDEPLLEVSTDKVDTEIPSPVAGTLQEIKVAEDETADVGAVLAIVGVAGAAPAKAEPKPEPKPEPKAEAKPEPKPEPKVEEPTPGAAYNEPAAEAEQAAQPAKAEAAAQPAAPAATQRRSVPAEHGEDAAGYVTPLVRKLAAEHGVDLGSVKGTGVGGRIRKQDVLEAAEKAKAAKPAPTAAAPAAKAEAPAQPAAKPQPSAKRGTTEKLPRIRATIAKRMQQSLHETAQLTTVVEVDVTRVAKLRARAKESFQAKHGVKLSFLPFFALAAVEALQTYPIVQASMDLEGGTITYPAAEHLGIAVDTERGLLVPVIHNAGDLNMGGIAKRIADLAERTRANKITPDEMAGATFTLTNTGSRGALFDTPIVPSPQSAMLGTGAVVKRPVVVNDPELGEVVAIRSMVYLAMSYDHRLIDGADAARFLTAVKERLEAGNFEAELGL
ncbi:MULTISPECIES: 2-oxoglutarate dehydrogenase, E2 component, dihydrolipoamide succinyltransferase [unclassified Micromonospora]|uniref:2-oxoglutarate dehydrogenase, E2 component, dihydrolipoamide succinyltransferase n=1 Tax=unclassified Micromonospora TaxID=2617518 RepID=UPI001129719E|nr:MULTISPECIES: 2-oxoglutarate dehydrogenase, E2 component, dihydrolipoamide succinyltransferase [unclassified Micromonospora]MCK1806375.1 2-oxoglutarate dehydrogenase, E2 component, dihydrolipoamide succinyltransferase [Micromonospora sp. R42106]MCK1831393.1 2-oxoglutarate dehydrogenase, E2 component, dihydrolipoamide succinyltransferase [Micromonospora sp. R42003]MCK1842908.1 2-oxoglutarate dehydrogenase, E2 component, dihydrolipoamide succinyltransferase [Micromonospora sp. R42004]MCM101960